MTNENRIVRVHNDDIHKLISYVSKTTKAPYQYVFNQYCIMVVEGHVFGDYTHYKLQDRVLSSRM